MRKRIIFLLVCSVLLLNISVAQKKQSWSNSFLYSFKLSPEVPPQFVEAAVLYKGKLLTAFSKKTGNKKQQAGKFFTFFPQKDQYIGAGRLPFFIPMGNFVCLMDADMLTEMTLYPERYKIRINITRKDIADGYELPAIFDFIPDHALNIAYLLSFPEEKRLEKINDNSWMLSMQQLPVTTEKILDTILTYTLSNVPKGILLAFPGINKMADTLQHFVIEKAVVFNQRLLMPVAVSKSEKLKAAADQCYGIYTDIDGKTCATSGCMTGRGSGDCAAMTTANNKRICKVSVIVSP